MPQSWFNPIVRFILKSPLHGFMSGNTMLITYTGRKTRKQHTLPIGYLRHDDGLTTISSRDRTWWKNLRGGEKVALLLRGQHYEGFGEVVENQAAVARGMATYLSQAPQLARYFQIALEPDGTPNEQDLARVAAQRVLIKLRLTPSNPQ